MPKHPLISIPLDIPDVRVLQTELTKDGQLIGALPCLHLEAFTATPEEPGYYSHVKLLLWWRNALNRRSSSERSDRREEDA